MSNPTISNALAVAKNLIEARRLFLEERISEGTAAIAAIDHQRYLLDKQRCVHFVDRARDQGELNELLKAMAEFEARDK